MTRKIALLTMAVVAAGLFTGNGELVCLREDVGRHNAFDKVIGWAALDGRLPLRGHVILASGRASFELTQKALMAGIPVLASVSAPSTLAVQLAAARNLSPEAQAEIAHVVLRLAGADDEAPVPFTAEAQTAIAVSKAAPARGEFATAEEVRAVWVKHGLRSSATPFRHLPASALRHCPFATGCAAR